MIGGAAQGCHVTQAHTAFVLHTMLLTTIDAHEQTLPAEHLITEHDCPTAVAGGAHRHQGHAERALA